MSGTIEDLSAEQESILNEFRERVEDILKPDHDDRFLLRWLRARNFDQDKAEIMLRKSMIWRKQIGADDLRHYKLSEVVKKYAPTAMLGFDKDGSSIRLLPQGNVDYKGLVASVRKHDIFKSICHYYEQDLHQMKLNNAKTGKKSEKFVYIVDYASFSLMQVASKPVWDVIVDILKLFEANYPERLKTAFAINVPPMFSTLFAAAKPFMAENTRKKFQIYGKDGWKEVLLKTIDPEVLPLHLGGTKLDSNGHSFLSCGGGIIPESNYIKNQINPRLAKCQESSRAQVDSRSVYPVEIHVPKDDSLIEWEVDSDGDIEVGFLHLKKVVVPGQGEELYPVEEVVPNVRLGCHMGSEIGSFYCGKAGFYILQFDNSFSKFRQKNVSYRYRILPPNEYD